jgi:hypothetical protein
VDHAECSQGDLKAPVSNVPLQECGKPCSAENGIRGFQLVRILYKVLGH